MKAMFSAQQQQSKKVSYAGKTVVGLVAAVMISAASVAGMSQQTGASPMHWSGAVCQSAAVVAKQGAAKTVVAAKSAKPVQLATN
jgi:hypothetical protein